MKKIIIYKGENSNSAVLVKDMTDTGKQFYVTLDYSKKQIIPKINDLLNFAMISDNMNEYVVYFKCTKIIEVTDDFDFVCFI
jgi:hypothetical protein